uniref:Uncharacterized protein n=1 Tax=Arundo donax TaxID=35708 RepID=A0A0A8YNZ3_ARUDO
MHTYCPSRFAVILPPRLVTFTLCPVSCSSSICSLDASTHLIALSLCFMYLLQPVKSAV